MSMSPVCFKTLAVESNPLTRFADLVYADRGLSSFPAGIEEADCIEKFESHGPFRSCNSTNSVSEILGGNLVGI